MARIARTRAHVWAAGGIFTIGMAIGGLYLSNRKNVPIVVNAAPAARVEAASEEGPVAGTLQIMQESMELAEVAIAAAKTASVAEKLPVVGEVEPVADRVALVTARVPGKIVALLAGVGDRVRAGQALARVASTDLATAQAAFQQAVARVDMARSNLQRQKELAALGEFGRPKLEAARAQLVGMQGSLNEAENEWLATQNEVWQAESERTTAEHEAGEAESALVEAQSAVTVARARLAQARSAVGVAESRFRRLDALYRDGLTSRQDWEEAQAEGEKARADVDAAEAGVSQAQAKTRAADSHIASARAAERQAAAKIATAQARERQIAAKRETARQQLAIARRTLAREQKVYTGRYLTSKEIVEAEAALRQADLERDAAAQSVCLLSGGRPFHSGDGAASGTFLLTSPIAGRVQDRRVTLGQTVNTEQALFTVANLDQIWVQLSVPPRDVRRVRPGQRVELTAEGAPGQTFRGFVSYVGTAAHETTRAVRVRCSLANASGNLRPGSFMRGALVTDERRDRVVVPTTALEEHSGKPTLYVERGGKAGSFEVRHVKLGVRGPGWREITEGLEPGEKIAVGGTFFLKSEALKSSLSDACCSAE